MAAACLDEREPMQPVEIEFFKPERRRYRSVFVVEDGLGLEAGLWGVLAAGGVFGHAKVIAGRDAHAVRV